MQTNAANWLISVACGAESVPNPEQVPSHSDVPPRPEDPIFDGASGSRSCWLPRHETRHIWQHHGGLKQSSFPTGYARNSRGQFSEVDTESFEVHKLRAWRRRAQEPAR